MKTPLLLPMFASLCLTAVANSQPPEQPRREPEPRRDSPEAGKPRPSTLHPEARRDEGRHVAPRNPPPPPRRPDFHSSPGEQRPEARGHRREARPVPPEIQELREQVRRLAREVEELRRIVSARHDSHGSPGRPRPDFHPPFQRSGPGPESRPPHPPHPPKDAQHHGNPPPRGDHRPHGDAGSHPKDRPHPSGDGPRRPDGREHHGNPPPR